MSAVIARVIVASVAFLVVHVALIALFGIWPYAAAFDVIAICVVFAWRARLSGADDVSAGIHTPTVQCVAEWLRGDEAETISNRSIRDGWPPEDALAAAIERRWLDEPPTDEQVAKAEQRASDLGYLDTDTGEWRWPEERSG